MPQSVETAPLFAGRYRRERVLGEGGMATVFLAWDTVMLRYRALKIITNFQTAKLISSQTRMAHEATSMAKLDTHPNILRVIDRGIEDGQPFIVMEYVEGKDVEEAMRIPNTFPHLYKRYPLAEVRRIMIGLLNALQATHEAGIVHRDVKPHNIMLANDGRVLLGDFGIAFSETSADLTMTGKLMGTPAFASYEQRVDGKHVDWRTDIYSATSTIFFMLAGRIEQDLYYCGLDRTLLKGVPDVFQEAIIKGATKLPDDRFQSVAELRGAMEAAFATISVSDLTHEPDTDESAEVAVVAPVPEVDAQQMDEQSPGLTCAPDNLSALIESTPPPVNKPPARGDEPVYDWLEDETEKPPRRLSVIIIFSLVCLCVASATAWYAWSRSEPTPATEKVATPQVTQEAVPIVAAATKPAQPVTAPQPIAVPAPEPALPAPKAEIAKPEATKVETKKTKPQVKAATPTPGAKAPIFTGDCAGKDGKIACQGTVTPAVPGATVIMRYRVGDSGRYLKKPLSVAGDHTYAGSLVVDGTTIGRVVQVIVDLRSDDLTEPLYMNGRTADNPFEVTP